MTRARDSTRRSILGTGRRSHRSGLQRQLGKTSPRGNTLLRAVHTDAESPTIVVLMQDSHNLTNLEFELIIHGRLELKLDTVDSATRRVGDNSTRSSTRKSCYRYDRSHANLGLDFGARSYRGIDVEASRSGAGYRTALKLDRWAQ